MNHSHAGLVRKFPEDFGRATNTDLNCPCWFQNTIEDRMQKWTAMVKLRTIDCAHRIAMSINVDQSHRPICAKCFEDRIRNRVVPSNGYRCHSRGT